MKPLFLFMLILFIPTCASGPSTFNKKDTPAEIQQGDLADCQSKVSSPGEVAIGLGLFGLYNADKVKAMEIDKCMEAKAYEVK